MGAGWEGASGGPRAIPVQPPKQLQACGRLGGGWRCRQPGLPPALHALLPALHTQNLSLLCSSRTAQNTLYELSLTKAGLPTKPEDVPEPGTAGADRGDDE